MQLKSTKFKKKNLAALVVAFVIIGAVLLFKIYAAGPLASFEAESSTLNGVATVGTDTNASGGKYVQFGSIEASTTHIQIGVYPAPFPLNKDVTPLDSYTNLVGKSPKIVMWYTNWTYPILNSTFAVDAVTQRGAEPMITWLPCAAGHCSTSDATYSPKAIASGEYDTFITQSAQQVKAWGKPLYIRLAHEMNGNWNSWGNVNGNTPSDYISMWQHVVQIFQNVGATNAQFVWSPNINPNGNLPFDSYFPGDKYVDWVALDGYNKGTDCAQWSTIGTLFKSSYDDITSISSKPFMIAETSSAEGPGGNKAEWITQSFLTDISRDLPNVKAVVWFDRDNSAQGGCEKDWRVDSSSQSLAAWKQIVTNPLYLP